MPLCKTVFSGFHILLCNNIRYGPLPSKEQIRNITRFFLVGKAESLVTVPLQLHSQID